MTDPSSPPSFDAIFSSQQHQRRSSSSTSSSYLPYAYQTPYTDNSHGSADQPLVEEPQQLFRPNDAGHGRKESATSIADMMAKGFNMDGKRQASLKQNSLRQDSFPFNPISDSTIIATAPGNNQGPQGPGYTSPPIGDIMFGRSSHQNVLQQQQQQQRPSQQHYQQQQQYQQQPQAGPSTQPWNVEDGLGQQVQYTPMQDQQYSPFHSPLPTAVSIHSNSNIDYMPQNANSNNDAFLFDPLADQRPAGSWGQDFLGHGDAGPAFVSAGGGDTQGGFDDILGQQDNDQEAVINELQRIISNTSHDGSPFYSREPSPFATVPVQQGQDPVNQLFQPPQSVAPNQHPTHQQQNQHQRTDSLATSRTGSPYPDMANQFSPGPAYQRAGSSPSANSPFFNKPQSPPALIIPNQHSPSPQLPPIVTTAVAGPSTNAQQPVSAPRQGDLGGAVMGGLLPPVNPALEHLTGMAGISPIAPNADGPMIYIQPSTPISGLKDGRGLFDAALRRAGQQAQQNQSGQIQQQGQATQLANPPTNLHNNSAAQNQGTFDTFDFDAAMASFQASQGWGNPPDGSLRVTGQTRPRAKSDSFMPSPTADSFDRQALFQMFGDIQPPAEAIQPDIADQWRGTVTAWRSGIMGDNANSVPNPTLDPRMLPGGMNGVDALQQFLGQRQQQSQPLALPTMDANQQHQLSQLQAQRNRLPPLNTNPTQPDNGDSGQAQGVFKYEPGEFSPTSMAFYQSIGMFPHSASELPGTTSAPFYTTTFGEISQNVGAAPVPATAGPLQQTFLAPTQDLASVRRKSFGGQGSHPAVGAGTPGYGTEFINTLPFSHFKVGARRAAHRRAAKSEDLGHGASSTGWGVGGGGSTADFLQSITANDGSLLPPSNRGRSLSHSRHSSASSVRSASPALSISSQGSSFSHVSPRMDMPEGVQIPQLYDEAGGPGGAGGKITKLKVTSVATEVASTSRRTNSGVFACPVPGCGSTFTRHFNLKGHLRSHNDERPYKCPYAGCPKAITGFARQHDCKRHMLLHEGLRPFECEGCGKKFARLDALTRHHKSEQGQECAISHPLPVNPDGSPMSESQYKAYKGIGPPVGAGGSRRGSKEEGVSGGEEGEDDEMDDA